MEGIILRLHFIMKRIISRTIVIFAFSLFIISGSLQARGIALGATRVIYPQSAKQTSLTVNNTSVDSRYLIQSWIEDEHGKKSTSFIITPPLFVSKAKSENALRIMYIGKPLPTDRESLFWLSSKSIPEVDSVNIAGKNVLQLAVLSRIKLFVRPDKLAIAAEDAPGKLRFKRNGNLLDIKNPTPYYITLVKFSVAGKMLPNTMLAPLNTTTIKLPGNMSGPITFQTINDYGAETPSQKGVEE